MVNIGAIMEYGASITMANGGTVVIPPRPFPDPAMEKYDAIIIRNYQLQFE